MMSDKVTYWKANATLSSEIIKLLNRREAMFRRVKAFAQQMGANPKDFVYSDWAGTTTLGALLFSIPPDPKLWCKVKNVDNGYRPRTNRSGELYKRWQEFKDDAINDVMQLIGMSRGVFFSNGGFGIQRPGVALVNGVAYLSIPDDTKPKGCIRVSDVTYEKVTKPQKAKRCSKKSTVSSR